MILLIVFSYTSGINPDPELRLSPENGNVAFASADMGWCFTLRSFAQLYSDNYGMTLPMFLHSWLTGSAGWSAAKQSSADLMAEALESPSTSKTKVPSGKMDALKFSERLWGDIYFDKSTRKFMRKAQDPSAHRTFVTFVLEPIYKLYAAVSFFSCFMQFYYTIAELRLGPWKGYRGVEGNSEQALDPFEACHVQNGRKAIAQGRP